MICKYCVRVPGPADMGLCGGKRTVHRNKIGGKPPAEVAAVQGRGSSEHLGDPGLELRDELLPGDRGVVPPVVSACLERDKDGSSWGLGRGGKKSEQCSEP